MITDFNEEEQYLFDREHTCPVCNKTFVSKSVMTGKAMSDGQDMDMRPRYKNIDTLKYRVLECPCCGYADLDKSFKRIRKRELEVLRANSIPSVQGASTVEGVRDYETAYRHYKSAIRCNLIRGAESGKRAITALFAGWILRGWRESIEKEGGLVSVSDTMSVEQEQKLINYAVRNFKDAEMNEDFPIGDMEESTFDFLMAVLCCRRGEYKDSERYLMRAIHSRTLKHYLRASAEDLREMLRDRRGS